jgi:hypothetical protein
MQDLVNPVSGIRNGKSRIRDKHPGSATLRLDPHHFGKPDPHQSEKPDLDMQH